MTLSDLAALGSFASGLAVTVTLVFLLIQMRQTNHNQRALMQQGRSAQQVDLLLRCTDDKLTAIRLKSLAGELSMTEQEIESATWMWLAVWRSFEDGYLQHQGGTIGSDSFQSDTNIIRFLLTYPSLRATWRMIRERYAPPFREHVDRILKDTSSAQPPPEADLWRALVQEERAAAAR